jgi:hypothetical protein
MNSLDLVPLSVVFPDLCLLDTCLWMNDSTHYYYSGRNRLEEEERLETGGTTTSTTEDDPVGEETQTARVSE